MNDYDVIFENRPVKTVILRLDPGTWGELLFFIDRGGCVEGRQGGELVKLISEVQRSISSRSAE